MKKLLGFLFVFGLVTTNIVVMANPSEENGLNNESQKVVCYNVITHNGDMDLVKCYLCQNVLDVSHYEVPGECKP